MTDQHFVLFDLLVTRKIFGKSQIECCGFNMATIYSLLLDLIAMFSDVYRIIEFISEMGIRSFNILDPMCATKDMVSYYILH